jgi:hypothetical protein
MHQHPRKDNVPIRIRSLLLLVLLLLPACAIGGRGAAAVPGAPAAGAAVQRFFELTNERNYGEMSLVFGTARGPFAAQVDSKEAELRMYLFSCVLRHDTYSLRNEQPIPGSVGAAVRYDVALRQGPVENVVPVRVVRAADGRWYVEDIRLEVVTQSQAPIPEECRRSLRL